VLSAGQLRQCSSSRWHTGVYARRKWSTSSSAECGRAASAQALQRLCEWRVGDFCADVSVRGHDAL
jgi:hypothetical protein